MAVVTQEHDFLDLELLRSDTDYQPRLDLKRARKMAERIDWDLIGLVVVNKRIYPPGGKHYHVVDGQHRVAALRIAGEEMAPCEIHRGLTLKEEADLFVRLQQLRRSRLITVDMYRALRAAENPHLLAFEQVAKECGLTVTLSSSTKNTVKGTKGLVDVTERYGPRRMRAALSALTTAWPNNKDAHTTKMIQGAALYAVCFPESIETCAERWKHTDPQRVEFNATHIRETEGGRTPSVYAKALAHANNLRTKVHAVDLLKINLVTIRERDR